MTMRMMVTALLAALVLVSAVAAEDINYEGMLTGPDSIVGTNAWSSGDTWIKWVVTQDTSGFWNYSYEFRVPKGDVSHFILEVSDGFKASDMFNVWTSWADPKVDIGTHASGSGNPNMPGTIYGIKFDETVGTTINFSFDSWRVPVWGDFYAKDGVWGEAWNAGFLDPDPTWENTVEYYALTDLNKILVPDTIGGPPEEVIPEIPASMLAGLGAPFAFSVAMLRRRLGKS
jgi:hypothetical protein